MYLLESLPQLTIEGALNFFPIGNTLRLLCFRTDFKSTAWFKLSNSPIILPSSSLPSTLSVSKGLLSIGGIFYFKFWRGLSRNGLLGHTQDIFYFSLGRRATTAHSFLKFFFFNFNFNPRCTKWQGWRCLELDWLYVWSCSGLVWLRWVEYTENRQGGANLKSVYGVTLISTSGQF